MHVKAKELITEIVASANGAVDKNKLEKGLLNLIVLIGIPANTVNLAFLFFAISKLLKQLPSFNKLDNDLIYLLETSLQIFSKESLELRPFLFKPHTTNKLAISKFKFPLYFKVFDNTFYDSKKTPEFITASSFIVLIILESKIRSINIKNSVIYRALFEDDLNIFFNYIKNFPQLIADNFESLVLDLEEEIHKLDEIKNIKTIINLFTNSISRDEIKDAPNTLIKPIKYPIKIISEALFEGLAGTLSFSSSKELTETIASDSKLEESNFEILQPEVLINKEKVSREHNNLAAKRTRNKNAMRSQFLRNDPNFITPYELGVICNQAVESLTSQDFTESLSAFCVLLTLTTGSEPKYWSNWLITNGQPKNEYLINVEEGWVCHPLDMEEGAWKSSIDQNAHLNNVLDYIVLPLEKHLINFFKQITFRHGKVLCEVLNKTALELDTLATEWVKNLFKTQNRWFTITRVRDWLFHELMAKHMDEAMASHISSQGILELSPSTNYATFSQQYLEKNYIEAFPEHLNFKKLESFDDSLIGSKLCLKDSYLKQFIQQLKNDFITLKKEMSKNTTLTEIINLHNKYTNYLLFIAFINTSHRPVIDPFARHIDFLKNKQAVFVTDKVIGSQNITRLCFYGDIFAEQLTHYEDHLKKLSYWLTNFDLEVESAKVNNLINNTGENFIPFFFYLRQDSKKLHFDSIKPASLDRENIAFNLPWNFGRHLRATKFRQLGVPAEYINYDFGHISAGEQPFGPFSAISVDEVAKQIVPAVNKINESLNIQSLEGMPFLQKKIRAPVIATFPNLLPRKLGFEIRKAKRNKNAKLDKNKVDVVFSEYIQKIDIEILKKEHLVQALDDLLKSEPSNITRALNYFTHKLTKYLTANNLNNIPVPCKLIEIKQEKSTFDIKSSALAYKAIKLQLKFRKNIHFLKFSKGKNAYAKRILGYLYLSLQLNGFISHPKLLAEIFSAIEQKSFLVTKEQFYLQIKTNGEVFRRIALDYFSFFILDNLLKHDNTLKTSNYKMKNIINYAKELLPELKEKVGFEFTISEVKQFTNMLSILTLPSFIIPVLNGDRYFESLNEDSFIRALSSLTLKEHELLDSTTGYNSINQNFNFIIKPFNPKDISLKHAKKQRAEINTVLRNKSIKNRTKLVSMLQNLWNDFNEDSKTLQITQLFLAWIIYTANSPSKRRQRLAIQTIEKISSYIGRYLTELGCKFNLLELEVEQLQDLYEQVVDISELNQTSRKETLKLFHIFLKNNFNVPDIFWGDIDVNKPDDLSVIDANILAETEYQKILNYLQNSAFSFKEELSLIFIFYFKLGFRLSEVFKISHKEIIIQGRLNSYIILKKNHIDSLKNDNSVRLVYFDNKLTLTEFELFENWFKNCHVINSTKSIWKIDQEESIRILSQVIKSITGDNKLSIRNLRHSYISYQVLTLVDKLYSPEKKDNLDFNQYYVERFNVLHPTRRCLPYLAMSSGHGGASTTLSNYTNNYEKFIISLINPSSEKQLTPAVLSKITNILASTLRVRKQRLPIEDKGKFVKVLFESLLAKYENYTDKVNYYTTKKQLNILIFNQKWEAWLILVENIVKKYNESPEHFLENESQNTIALYYEMMSFVIANNFNPFGLKIIGKEHDLTWNKGKLRIKLVENQSLLKDIYPNDFKEHLIKLSQKQINCK